MQHSLPIAWRRTILWLLPGVLAVTGCLHVPLARTTSKALDAEAQALRSRLVGLSPHVAPAEADWVVDCAFDYSRQLAVDYRVVRPPWFHNILVNLGVKERGLCHQWADDLLSKFREMNLSTLTLYWGIARADTWREHNSIVIAAVGQPFEQGIVLDPWRESGRLVWSPVSTDRYPWREGMLEPANDSPTPR